MTLVHPPLPFPAAAARQTPVASASSRRSRTVAFVLAVCAPLLVVLASAKALNYLPLATVNLAFPLKVAIVAYADLLFVCGWGALGLAGLLATQRHPTVHRAARVAFFVGSVVIGGYGIASYQVYDALRMPLTVPLLRMAGGWSAARSSLGSYVTVTFTLAALSGLLAYGFIAIALMRVRLLERRWVWCAVLGAGAVALPALHSAHARWIAGGPKDGLARSPHWALLASFGSHLAGASEMIDVDPGEASAEHARDFQTFAERGHGSSIKPTPQVSHFAGAGGVKNVIVVVLESTGTQFLSAYGADYPTTPHLDAEAKHALVFENFYANAGYTLHAMLPLTVSLYPGTGFDIYLSDYPAMPATSIAQALKSFGYRTAFLTSQAMNYRSAHRFFDNRGYDVFTAGEKYITRDGATELSSWGVDDKTMFDDLLRFIGDAGASAPFYAMAWTQQSHHPYPLAPGDAVSDLLPDDHPHAHSPDLNAYLNTIRVTDAQLGRLFQALRVRGLADETLVVITGDHGESFGFPHHWTFHGTSLYDEGIRVPLILWNPKLFAGGQRRTDVGGHVDLNPTLLDILGVAPPGDWQGSSLFDPAHPDRAYFTCNTGNLLLGVREGPMKYIYNLTQARGELYDLSHDPTEQINLAAQRPADAATYRRRLAAWMKYEKAKQQRIVAATRK